MGHSIFSSAMVLKNFVVLVVCILGDIPLRNIKIQKNIICYFKYNLKVIYVCINIPRLHPSYLKSDSRGKVFIYIHPHATSNIFAFMSLGKKCEDQSCNTISDFCSKAQQQN